MSDVMSFTFSGRLTRNPSETANGAVMTVASNKVFNGTDGEQKERTEYITVWLRNGVAKNALQYLVKGQEVTISATSVSADLNTYNGTVTARLSVNGVVQLKYGSKPNGATAQDVPEEDDGEDIPF